MGRTVTKSIAIIGEGETEWFYFDSLRIACRYPFKVAPDFPQHSDINHILKLVESYLNKQYDYIVCLFDMDRLYQFPSEMQQYQKAKKEYNKKKYAGRVLFIETNPCTEFWFLLHFLPNMVCRTSPRITKVHAGVRENQAILHTHQPLQILNGERRLRTSNVKLRKAVPTLS